MIPAFDHLVGDRVVIQPFRLADLTIDYVGWLNNPDVVRFSNQRFRSHSLESCASYFQSFSGTPNQFLSIRLRSDDRAIGTMTVYASPQHGTADVGIMIGDPAQRGTGIGGDAWPLLIDWLIEAGGVRKVTAGTLRCNIAMVRLMQRSRMHEVAVRKAQEIVQGRSEDVLHYARFRTD